MWWVIESDWLQKTVPAQLALFAGGDRDREHGEEIIDLQGLKAQLR